MTSTGFRPGHNVIDEKGEGRWVFPLFLISEQNNTNAEKAQKSQRAQRFSRIIFAAFLRDFAPFAFQKNEVGK